MAGGQCVLVRSPLIKSGFGFFYPYHVQVRCKHCSSRRGRNWHVSKIPLPSDSKCTCNNPSRSYKDCTSLYMMVQTLILNQGFLWPPIALLPYKVLLNTLIARNWHSWPVWKKRKRLIFIFISFIFLCLCVCNKPVERRKVWVQGLPTSTNFDLFWTLQLQPIYTCNMWRWAQYMYLFTFPGMAIEILISRYSRRVILTCKYPFGKIKIWIIMYRSEKKPCDSCRGL